LTNKYKHYIFIIVTNLLYKYHQMINKTLFALGTSTSVLIGNVLPANAGLWDWLNTPITFAQAKSVTVFVAKKTLFGVTVQVMMREIPAGQYAPLHTYALRPNGATDDYYDKEHCKNTSKKYGPTFVRFNGKNNVCYSVYN
jgi:hypothetical protein